MFDIWFKETKVFSIENGLVKVLVPFLIHKTHLKKHYNERLEEILREALNVVHDNRKELK